MSKLIVGLTAGLLATGLFGSSGEILQPPVANDTIIAQANEQALIKQNRDLLDLALKLKIKIIKK